MVKRKVVQFSARSGRFVGKYDSIKEASEKNKINKDSIYKVCRGILKSSGGYVFKYYDDVVHIAK